MISSNPIGIVKETSSYSESRNNDIKKLVGYVNYGVIEDAPQQDTFSKHVTGSVVPTVGLFGGLPVVSMLKKQALIKKFSGNVTNAAQTQELFQSINGQINKAWSGIFKGEGKLTERIVKYFDTIKDAQAANSKVKDVFNAQFKQAKAVKKAKGAASEVAKSFSDNIAKGLEAAEESVGNIGKNVVKNNTKELGKIGKFFKKISDSTFGKAGNALNKLTKGKFGKFGKFMKSSGAGFMLAFSGITEALTEVVPTFKELGFKKGMKQLGKSSVKVVADTAGYVAGNMIGSAVGTKLGAIIGSAICPGVGTVIGSAIGFAGGMLGSFIAGKIVKPITGKSEREKSKELDLDEKTSQVTSDKAALDDLKNQAIMKINEEIENGYLSNDSQKALEILNNLENPFAEFAA